MFLLLSKCKTSGKSGKKSERSATEDNTFLSGKISLLNGCGSEFFTLKRVEYCYQNYNFHSFQSGFSLKNMLFFNSLNEWILTCLHLESSQERRRYLSKGSLEIVSNCRHLGSQLVDFLHRQDII